MGSSLIAAPVKVAPAPDDAPLLDLLDPFQESGEDILLENLLQGSFSPVASGMLRQASAYSVGSTAFPARTGSRSSGAMASQSA